MTNKDTRYSLTCNNFILKVLIINFRSPRVQRYLVRVYGNLALTTASASVASILSMRGFLGEMGLTGFLASLALLFGMQLARGRVSDYVRLGMLMAFGFLQGWSVGPLTGMVFDLDPELLLMAVVGTMLAFVSFTGAALFSQRRSYLYLGGLLSFGTMALMISSFFPFMFNFNLYLGLFVFCFYIIYDTQVMVERADIMRVDESGIDGALQLFTNLIAIFVRLLVILSQDKSKKKKKERKN